MVFGPTRLQGGQQHSCKGSRRQPLPTLRTSHLHGEPKFLTQPKTGNFSLEGGRGGKAWSSEGALGTSPCSSPAGLTATLEPPRGCLLLLLPKLQQKPLGMARQKGRFGVCFVLFFFQEVFYGRGKKALERQGECHGAPPRWILMGFPTFERDRNTV